MYRHGLVFFSLAFTMVIGMMAVGSTALAEANPPEVRVGGEYASRFQGFGTQIADGETLILHFGELKYNFGLTPSFPIFPVRANCNVVDGAPSNLSFDQLKKYRKLNEVERGVMAFLQVSYRLNIGIVPKNEKPGYPPESYDLHLKSVQCAGPSRGSWQDYVCIVQPGH